jgi:FKBP-type peptidyl-prolyl cis-trans isomerase
VDNNEMMEDSRHYNKGHPMVFHLGHFQSIKCWELAIISMQAGEEIDMICPHYYAYGGTGKYSHFGSK